MGQNLEVLTEGVVMKQACVRFLVALLALNLFSSPRDAAAQSAGGKAELSGLASVSGTVTSVQPFQAAKVYFRNTDQRMQYMVYTAGGKYQAMYLLPGKYEMRVEARGLDSAVAQVTLGPGNNAPQNAALRPVQSTGTAIVAMDEMFPPGAGQKYVKEVCLGCHGPDLFGSRQLPAPAWNGFVEMMVQNGSIPQGFATAQEREDLVQYLGKHFGPEAR